MGLSRSHPLYERYDAGNNDPLQIISTLLPMYVCPSESAPHVYTAREPPEAITSYAGNSGTGVLDDGYNGMFRHIVGWNSNYPKGPIRAAGVRDGLSNTALASEVLTFTPQFERLRINWNTPGSYNRGEMAQLVAECDSSSIAPPSGGLWGAPNGVPNSSFTVVPTTVTGCSNTMSIDLNP